MTTPVEIPIAEIRLDGEGWDRYIFNVAPKVDALAESIRRAGLTAPLTLLKDNTIVRGYARALAMRALGMKSAPVFIIEEADEERLLNLGVEDNRFTRQYHYLDAARLMRAYSEHCGYGLDRLAREIAPRIGFPGGEKSVAQCLRLNDLAEDARKFLVEKNLSHAHALLLLDFPPRDTGAVAALFHKLGANANEAREIAETLSDLSRIRKQPAGEIIALPELRDANKMEFRARVRRMRYPTLAAAEEEFDTIVAKLRLDTNAAVSHSPNFETDAIRINITARSARNSHPSSQNSSPASIPA